MTWAKTYSLRFIPFSIAKDASNYGTGNYGDGTYGQEASDPLSNVEYTLAAKPGGYPDQLGWIYRQGDANVPFQAQVLGLDGPMNLTAVASAALVLERLSAGPRLLHALPVTLGTTDGLVTVGLPATVLESQGVYRVAVQLVFTSGRAMTVTADDQATLMVRGVL
jgi:hypothetical protein